MKGLARRRALQNFLGGLIFLGSFGALALEWQREPQLQIPQEITSQKALLRPDGGQMLLERGYLPPNALTLLNLGKRLTIMQTPPELLAALPSLGLKSARRAQANNRLTKRQCTKIGPLVQDLCPKS